MTADGAGAAGRAERAPVAGRRERNKQAKLERIIAAATALFAEHGVDDVTTQQIAEAADIGAGTLFLYVRSKGELLLMVQNAVYRSALEEGVAAAARRTDPLEAVLALVTPVVRCNRAQIDNGRTYLREMVFGDPQEPHHAAALEIVAQTDRHVAGVLADRAALPAQRAEDLAAVVSAVLFIAMASSPATVPVDEILRVVRERLAAVLHGWSRRSAAASSG